MRIAVLDDDKTQLQMVEHALIGGDNEWGEEVECQFFTSGQALLQVIKREFFDVMILDRRVADMSGDVILQWVRQYGEKAHHDYSIVLMLTSMRAEGDVVNSLALGANDYLAKPFRSTELVARIKRAVDTKRSLEGRRPHSQTGVPELTEHDDNSVDLHGYRFEPFNHTIYFRGRSVVLTEREFALALMLFRNAGRSVSRQAIFETVWRRIDAGNNRTLDTHIYRVRHQLDLAGSGLSLKPVYGFGYRLDVSTQIVHAVSVVENSANLSEVWEKGEENDVSAT